ncbi:MAG: NAD-dependent protein deacylase [Firmicutes bacterium]|nr:NAD-dependent protein deacylase [Bacillota bacterium]
MNGLQAIIDSGSKIVFFSGAGVSTESGIPDFRSSEGLYLQEHETSPEEILSHDYFMKHPSKFYRFYREKMVYDNAKPNECHLKIAELERTGRLLMVVTQNIDGLHSAAGSKNVAELHGSIYRNHCIKCGKAYSLDIIKESSIIPICSCGGIIKPDVVLYGEPLDSTTVQCAATAISQADTLIVAGTSLTVYPAAGLIKYFRGRNLVIINRDITNADNLADLVIHEKVGKVFSDIVIK